MIPLDMGSMTSRRAATRAEGTTNRHETTPVAAHGSQNTATYGGMRTVEKLAVSSSFSTATYGGMDEHDASGDNAGQRVGDFEKAATYHDMRDRIAVTCASPPPSSRRIVDQAAHLPVEEPSKRTYLERIARWEKAGRCVVTRAGKRRVLKRANYERLLLEDSARGARRAVSADTSGDDAAADLAELGYRAKA